MAANIQQRSEKFQLRVKHALLPRPFFFTFQTAPEAEDYRDKLLALLSRGVVPAEMLSKPRGDSDPMLTEVIGDYQRETSITDSDDELFQIIKVEVVAVRMSAITFTWAESYVRSLKAPAKHLAPSTIRKRAGALGRAIDWHIKRTTKDGETPRANPLRLMTRGYSVYSKEDAKITEPKFDQKRNRRFGPGEAERVSIALAGVKREDRERKFTNDPEFKMLYQLILGTGIRLFEAYRMRVENIDFKINVINVEGSKGHRGVIKPRIVPIKPELRAPLRDFCAGRGDGLVFCYWDGDVASRKRTQGKLTQRFLSLFDYAEVPDFSEHDLRHEATCRWFELRNERGWIFSEIEICKIMGWSNFDLAIRYASLRGEDLSSRLG